MYTESYAYLERQLMTKTHRCCWKDSFHFRIFQNLTDPLSQVMKIDNKIRHTPRQKHWNDIYTWESWPIWPQTTSICHQSVWVFLCDFFFPMDFDGATHYKHQFLSEFLVWYKNYFFFNYSDHLEAARLESKSGGKTYLDYMRSVTWRKLLNELSYIVVSFV